MKKIFESFKGVQCVCGSEKLVRQLTFADVINAHLYHTVTYRCFQCGKIPLPFHKEQYESVDDEV